MKELNLLYESFNLLLLTGQILTTNIIVGFI